MRRLSVGLYTRSAHDCDGFALSRCRSAVKVATFCSATTHRREIDAGQG
jgi:hypothetical protein